MSSTAVPLFDKDTGKEASFGKVLGFSVLFHILLLVVLPLVTRLVWQHKNFERPKTFQLVTPLSLPTPPRPVPKREAPRQRVPVQEKKPAPSPDPKKIAPKKDIAPQVKKEAARPVEENLDELASLLEELPAPAQVSAIGDFKYHWYLNNVMQKLERYWKPSTENREMKVEVAFTIFVDGSISEPVIKKPSGNSSLDNLALRAVKLAAPFGKLPPGFTGDRLDLNCTLIPTRK